MDFNMIWQIILFIGFEIALPLVFVGLMHYKLSKYPKPFKLDKDKKKIIIETLVIWILVTLVFAFIILSEIIDETTKNNFSLMFKLVLFTSPVFVIIPALYFHYIKKWTLNDFWFRKPLKSSRTIMIFSLIIFIIAGSLPLLNSNFTPVSIGLIMLALLMPAFYEEFLFRVIIQGNLEKAIGQNKAWIYGWILFGLAHVTTNIFVEWFDFIPGLIQLFGQITAWWMFGILYMKTRSIWPGMLVHFLTNGTLASIIALSVK